MARKKKTEDKGFWKNLGGEPKGTRGEQINRKGPAHLNQQRDGKDLDTDRITDQGADEDEGP